MSDSVLQVQNLSKRYILGHQIRGRSRYVALRDVLTHKFTSLFRRNAGLDAAHEEFWALKDVSFEIKQGESVGIIGRNGAGKSTLLKILSRITSPSAGRVEIEGRVSSLLEVGTGFHPEMTGRENIFLNGAILGMKQYEIKRKFDEIVSFAEVEKFLDTPVKHFSSGMYVRLAFAVAAHLEPDILIVDEVLAVGDAQFQKKCLGKMKDVTTKEGRTILFVSHNMDAVTRLCTSAILLQGGKVAKIGTTSEVISSYLTMPTHQEEIVSLMNKRRVEGGAPNPRAFLNSAAAGGKDSHPWVFPFGSHLIFRVTFDLKARVLDLEFLFAIFTSTGTEIASSRHAVMRRGEPLNAGHHEVTVTVPHLRLVPGRYHLNLAIHSEYGREDFITEAVFFDVSNNSESAMTQADQVLAACVPETYLEVETI